MTDSELGPGPFWWCLDHERVEGRHGCANTVRLGPYETVAEAEQALQTAHERTKKWESDSNWNDR